MSPRTGILACALDPVTEERRACTGLELDGHYVLSGLPVGTYVISFALDRDEEGLVFPDGYVRRYWQEVSNFGEATPIGSATSTVIPGIDAAITFGTELPLPAPKPAPAIAPPPVTPPPVVPILAGHPKPKLKCKKGFRRRAVGGHKTRCVKVHRREPAKRHRRRPPTSERGERAHRRGWGTSLPAPTVEAAGDRTRRAAQGTAEPRRSHLHVHADRRHAEHGVRSHLAVRQARQEVAPDPTTPVRKNADR